MKKSFALPGALVGFLAVGCMVLPQPAGAIVPNKWEGRYEGPWDDLHDSCGDTEQDGTITIKLKEIKQDGRITSAAVFFDDDAQERLDATGKIFFKDGKRRIRLRYLKDSGDYVIKARLTDKKKIRGSYYHSAGSCIWGGSVEAEKVS
jgi:hypothetical protein